MLLRALSKKTRPDAGTSFMFHYASRCRFHAAAKDPRVGIRWNLLEVSIRNQKSAHCYEAGLEQPGTPWKSLDSLPIAFLAWFFSADGGHVSSKHQLFRYKVVPYCLYDHDRKD
jgi:hypothetical protein